MRRQVPVNAVVPPAAPSEAAVVALEATRLGITCLKVKVGIGDDLGRVSEVRSAVGPNVKIRIDANGAWDLDTACRHLRALARYDIELAEQPVASLEDLARLRRLVATPLAADEAVRDRRDAERLVALDAADVLVVKVQPLGGVRAALTVVEAAGLPAIVTSMIETSIGLAAGLALAASLPDLPYALRAGHGHAARRRCDAEPVGSSRRDARRADRRARCGTARALFGIARQTMSGDLAQGGAGQCVDQRDLGRRGIRRKLLGGEGPQ